MTVTRWVSYDVTAAGSYGTGGQDGKGTRGYSLADASVGDTFTIGSNSNKLYLSIDGVSAPYITLASGTDLDPRFVARDITEKIHNLGKGTESYDRAQCVWENNKLKIYSGALGIGSQVQVVSGTDTSHIELGFGTSTETIGSATSNNYADGLTVSGTYDGFFDEIYKVVINKEMNVGSPTKGGSNEYTGTMTAGGVFNNGSDITYNITIDTTNGTTMGGGTGNVPTMSWTSTGNVDDSSSAVELLYPDYWYKVGTKGVQVKFTDAVFNTCDPAWTVACTYPQYVEGSNTSGPAGTAKYVWSSSRGDDSTLAETTSSSAFTRLGSRGLYIKFNDGASNFNAGDEFYIMVSPPQPSSYDITTLSYGNVTVSTESGVKCVIFEIVSGAIELSNVKFGLFSHGNFEHHNAGNNDTKFRFGTIGPGSNAGTSPIDGKEWRSSVTSSDISSDTPPSYLSATKENLAEVTDADQCETIGTSGYMGMTTDPIFMGIRLGASEVGANSSIAHRIFFDYS